MIQCSVDVRACPGVFFDQLWYCDLVSCDMGGLLQVGLNHPLHIREEHLSSRQDCCRLLYVSDVHLRPGRSEQLCQQIFRAAEECQPHAILLGGDLVDRRCELYKLSQLIGELRSVSPVLAIGGNHDSKIGLALVREAVERGGGQWIHDDVASFLYKGRSVAVRGPQCDTKVEADVHVLCAHYPQVWRMAKQSGYDLVLAGHLHGCQAVMFQYRDRLFPGAFFYPYCFLSQQRGSARLVVSRGVSDLIPIRWRCPREVVLCYV